MCSTVIYLLAAGVLTQFAVPAVCGSPGGPAGDAAAVPRQDADDEPAGDGDCYVVTIFGLKTADCRKQNARTVPQSLDSDLQVLRFEDNRLTVLGDGEFASYANLQEIYVSRNNIELLERTALRGLYSLQRLDLEANQLSDVPATALRAVATSLRLLSLKNNPIRQLEADSLSSLTRLEEVNFENCWLEYVDALAFSRLQRLSTLNLVNNELRTIDAAMQASLPQTLRVVRLYRNPWTCDCRLRWLRRWLVAERTDKRSSSDADLLAARPSRRSSSDAELLAARPSRRPSSDAELLAARPSRRFSSAAEALTVNWDFASNTPTCAAPALIRSVAWRHLTPDQFACPSRIIVVSSPGAADAGHAASNASTAGVRAIAGANATLQCVAAGDPEPIVSWSRGGRDDVLRPPRAYVSVRRATSDSSGDREPRIVSTLTLLDVSAAVDVGDYRCVAENTAGRAEMTVKMTVSSPAEGGASTSSGGSGGGGLWPIDRDAFLGTLLALLGVACIIILCVVLRLRNIARQRRRTHNKNVYYLADNATGNHIDPSTTSNHMPAAAHCHDALVLAQAPSNDDDRQDADVERRSSNNQQLVMSARQPLLVNHTEYFVERATSRPERHGRKHCTDVTSRRGDSRRCESAEEKHLLNSDASGGEMERSGHAQNVDEDNASLSERLSAASDQTDSQLNCESPPSCADDLSNRQDRPSRAVSFGPDMIIDSAVRRHSSTDPEHDDASATETKTATAVAALGESDQRRDEHRSSVVDNRQQDPSVQQYSSVDRGPCSVATVRNRCSLASAAPQLPGVPLPVSQKLLDVRPAARQQQHRPPVGNGSAVRDRTASSRLPLRSLSPPAAVSPAAGSPLPLPLSRCRPCQSGSLERRPRGAAVERTRRRLPDIQPRHHQGPVLDVRRSPQHGSRFRDFKPHHHQLHCHRAAGIYTPVSLADLLESPFTTTTAPPPPAARPHHTSLRAASLSPSPLANSVFDDDSGTDI